MTNIPRPVTPLAAQNVDPQLLQEMLIALTNLQLQISSQQQSSSPSRDPRVPDVPVFNGNKSQYSVFLARLKNFFNLQPKSYDTDKKKIGYVVSRLEGAAADWAVTVLENPNSVSNFGVLDDWDKFLNSFSKFSDPFSRRNATDALLSLSQGGFKSQSVLGYWTKFSELLYRSNISPDSAKPLFERGLKYEIRDRLVDKDLPDDLDSYVMAVVDLDNRLYRLRQDRKTNGGHSVDFSSRFSSVTIPPLSGVAPMDIGALQTTKADSKERWDEIRKMDPEQRRKVCFEEHRCHYCKRVVGNPPVHVAQNCPVKENKTKSDYLKVLPEAKPQMGIPDMSVADGIPQRQVFGLSHPDMNFTQNVSLYIDGQVIPTKALIDSGAMGFAYIDSQFVRKHDFCLVGLKEPVTIRTVDGSPCGIGKITEKVVAILEILDWKQEIELYVISSPSVPIILGCDWLKTANPVINWKNGVLSFCKGTPDSQDGVPQRQVFIDLINMQSNINHVGKKMDLNDLLEEYTDVFSSEDFPKLSTHRPGIDIDLELIEGKVPPFGPIYSLSQEEEGVLREYIEGAMKTGLIRKSTSPAGSPVMFVKKPDGSLRLCVDYRALNAVLKTDRTALPIIKDMLQRTKGSRYFSKIDLKSAFYLIRIVEGKEYLTAFRTKYGHYEYNVMPFGLKNAPGTFQGFMNYIFSDLIDRGLVVYIDDLLLYSETYDEHLKLLLDVFERIRKYELVINRKKCSFISRKIAFLGHILSEEGIEMDDSKLKVIEEWKFPRSVKQMRSFLGLANYYRDFIPSFSKIAAPLFDLTKGNTAYTETEQALKSFHELKGAFRKNNILMFPDQNSQFFLEVDASDYAIGGALHQVDVKTQKLRPIGFFSRKLSGPEQNYEIYDKELLAVIEGFKTWRYLLIGTNLPVEVYTDHRNLEYFMTAKILNRRQARWAQFLADFNFTLKYRAGETQLVADALSRQEEFYLNAGDRQLNHQTLLPEHLFTDYKLLAPINVMESELTGDVDEDLDSEEVLPLVNENHMTEEDSDVDDFEDLWPHLYQYLDMGTIPMVIPTEHIDKIKRMKRYFTLKDSSIHRLLKVNGHQFQTPYLAPSQRKDIISKYHQVLGHLAADSIVPLLERKVWWPEMRKDVQEFCKKCALCSLDALDHESRHELHPHPAVGLPFLKWGLDFIQSLPPSRQGNTEIITAIDYSTKLPLACATNNRRSRTVADFIFKEITCRFGSPEIIVTDAAASFSAEVLQEYLEVLKIKHLPSTPYHPQTNGAVERMHRTLKGILRKLCRGDWSLWEDFLPQALLILSARTHSATGYSPFYLCHGVEPRLPLQVENLENTSITPSFLDSSDIADSSSITGHYLEGLGQARGAALAKLQAQSERMKKWYDNYHSVSHESYVIGELVKLKNNAKSGLDLAWTGPYYVVGIGLNDTYYLMNTQGRSLPNPHSFDRLARWTSEDINLYYSGHGNIEWDNDDMDSD